MKYKLEIPLKLPSLNDYINSCRYNKHFGASMKKDTQKDIRIFIRQQLRRCTYN